MILPKSPTRGVIGGGQADNRNKFDESSKAINQHKFMQAGDNHFIKGLPVGAHPQMMEQEGSPMRNLMNNNFKVQVAQAPPSQGEEGLNPLGSIEGEDKMVGKGNEKKIYTTQQEC